MGVSSDFCKRRMDWRSAAGDAGEIARNGDVGFFFGSFPSMLFGCARSTIFLREAWIGGEVWVMVQANSQGTVMLVFGILLPPLFPLSPPFDSFGCVHFKQFSRTMD